MTYTYEDSTLTIPEKDKKTILAAFLFDKINYQGEIIDAAEFRTDVLKEAEKKFNEARKPFEGTDDERKKELAISYEGDELRKTSIEYLYALSIAYMNVIDAEKLRKQYYEKCYGIIRQMGTVVTVTDMLCVEVSISGCRVFQLEDVGNAYDNYDECMERLEQYQSYAKENNYSDYAESLACEVLEIMDYCKMLIQNGAFECVLHSGDKEFEFSTESFLSGVICD